VHDSKRRIILTDKQIQDDILTRLNRRRVWGGKHTDFEHLKKGVPAYLSGDYLQNGKTLIKEGLLIQKKTNYGLQVALNPRRRKEIQKRIEESLE